MYCPGFGVRQSSLPVALSRRGHDGGAAGGDDDAVGLLQGALAVVPGRNSGLVFGDQALAPDLLAGLGVQAMQRELGVERKDEAAVNGGDGAGDGVIGTNFALLRGTARSACRRPGSGS